MATLTRLELVERIEGNLKREDKTTEIQNALNDMLKEAVNKHYFALTIDLTEVVTVASQNYVDTPSDLLGIITLSMVERDGGAGGDAITVWPLVLKNRLWWEKYVIDDVSISSGKPDFAYHDRTNAKLYITSIPDTAVYYVRFWFTKYPSMSADGTTNPIPVLDLWLVSRVTELIFRSLERWKAAAFYERKAKEQMADAKSVDKRQPAKQRQREMRTHHVERYPIPTKARTTGLYNQTWVIPGY